jgi:hypothetical protein
MSIGNMAGSEGMTVRSPSHATKSPRANDMEDVEIGSNNSRTRLLKAKESDVMELSSGESQENTSGSSSAMKSLIASTMYSGCSVGMVLVNKSLASRCAIDLH